MELFRRCFDLALERARMAEDWSLIGSLETPA
jgi:hypothetical protein